MRRRFSTFALLVCLVSGAPLVHAGALDAFSSTDLSSGLRQALDQGAQRAVAQLGQPDGFLAHPKLRITLPKSLREAQKAARLIGQDEQFVALETAMNRAAEAAVPQAKSLLLDAVRQMSVEDARAILSGGDDSVTRYFRGKTAARLTDTFLPIVHRYTEQLGVARLYDQLAGQGVGLGLVKQEDASVDRYVTRKALDGLYAVIAQEERAIRKNPVGAAGDLARKVFGALGG